MNKSKFLLLIASLLTITGCNNVSSSSSNNDTSSSESTSNVEFVSSESSSSHFESISSEESSSNTVIDSSVSSQTSSSSENSVTSSSTSTVISSQSSTSSSTGTVVSSQSSTSSISSSIASSSNSTISSEGNYTYTGYYSSISASMSAQQLQSKLTDIIAANYNNLGYDGLLSAYRTTDCRPGTNIIWDMYSNQNYVVNGPKQNQNYKKEGDSYNREHSIPQSWFNEKLPMKADAFHVYPTDGYVNNRRSNFPYGEVKNPTYTSENGSKLGSSFFAGYSGTVFEPIDEYKGDFARTFFYFATRYPNKALSGNGSVVFSSSFPYLTPYAINLFTKWSSQDPVSEKEVLRNEAVFQLQKNRNPFIDHPEFINKIFGGNTTSDYTPNNPDTPVVEKTDQEYANEVIALIDKIGTVTISSASLINNARAAYDKLTDAQKLLVTNYSTLIEAEEDLAALTEALPNENYYEFRLSDDALISGNLNWSYNYNPLQYDSSHNGVQFTYNSFAKNTLILETVEYPKDISQIILSLNTNASSNTAEVKVFVNDIQIGETTSIAKDLNSYTFNSDEPLKGKIRLEFTSSNTSKSLYISSISFK